jgi:hypothetical protein
MPSYQTTIGWAFSDGYAEGKTRMGRNRIGKTLTVQPATKASGYGSLSANYIISGPRSRIVGLPEMWIRRCFVSLIHALRHFRQFLRAQRDPLQRSRQGDRSTVPEAIKSSRFPFSSASSSNAVRTIPACKVTRFPSASSHVSLWERQSSSPNSPLKFARTRIVLDSPMDLFWPVATTLSQDSGSTPDK